MPLYSLCFLLRAAHRDARGSDRCARAPAIECLDVRAVLSGTVPAMCTDTSLDGWSPPSSAESPDTVLLVEPVEQEQLQQLVAPSDAEVQGPVAPSPWVSCEGAVVDLVMAASDGDAWAGGQSAPIAENIAAPTLVLAPGESGVEREEPGAQAELIVAELQFIPPFITGFAANEIDGHWTFSGRVVDEKSVFGLTVRFGGLLQGQTATTAEDGSFEITTTFPPGTMGGVSAVATDLDGVDSEPEYAWVVT